MKTFIKIAWRNIMRNKKRSGIIIAVIAISLAIFIFVRGIQIGSYDNMIENYTGYYIGHIQIHKKGFTQRMNITDYIENSGAVREVLSKQPDISFAERIVFSGLIGSGENSTGVMIVGIDPPNEKRISKLYDKITEGSHLTKKDEKLIRNVKYTDEEGHEETVTVEDEPIVIGEELAENLEIGLRDKVIVYTQTTQGDFDGVACRVKGVFRTGVEELDKITAFIPINLAQDLLRMPNKVNTFVIKVDPYKKMDEVARRLKQKLNPDGLEVLTWIEAYPMMDQLIRMDYISGIFILVFVLLIVFAGILNVILMSAVERTKEFGVMMALGTKGHQISLLVAIESFLLGLVGTTLGAIGGSALVLYFARKGIDLSKFSAGLEAFYFEPVIRPIFKLGSIVELVVILMVVTVLASIYPAWKASRLEPVDAIRGG